MQILSTVKADQTEAKGCQEKPILPVLQTKLKYKHSNVANQF